MLIDTHCHLDAEEFSGQQSDLLLSAHIVGVERIVIPSLASNNFHAVQQLCTQYPNCFPAYGIHPMSQSNVTDLTTLRDYLCNFKPVAIGEIGLDFFIDNFDPIQQNALFIEQLKLAREFNLPVLLHSRRALDPVLKNLRKIKVNGGISHAFNGSREQAYELIKLGFKLGFGGTITYPRATRIRELATSLPLDSIVLETDAPDIQPAFINRGQPNKPEYLARIAQTLADLRGISLTTIAQATTENALRVLPKLNV